MKVALLGKQKSYKGDRLRDSGLKGITRSASYGNLVTNFAQYKNFVCLLGM